MLFELILLLIGGFLGYLFYVQNGELKQLQKYSSNLENDLLQKQIKLEEMNQHTNFSEGDTLLNMNDPLTGFPSLQVFNDRTLQTFHLSQRSGKSFGILFFTIQDYNAVTQRLGVEKSSHLLNEVAKRLNGCIRQIDTGTHYGDGTFLFLIPQLTQPETAAYVAQRMTQKFKEPIYIDDKDVLVNTSVGISVYPVDGYNLNTLLECAETALQNAKKTATSYLFYSDELQQLSQREVRISEVINSEKLAEKIEIYCSPQVNAVTNTIVGVKAVPIIQDAEMGILRYEDFMKLAEREHKMTFIVSELLTKVIPKFKQWESKGLKLERLAFNVSIKQIQNDEFINTLSRIITENDFDPKRLALEISADNFSENASSVQDAFVKLNDLGVQLSVGVFALGQLAIQKITKLPIKYLKIDQRLIKSLSQYNENEVILTALMNLSTTLGLEMIAEGVDEDKQREILEKLGFEIMQGKVFGDPQPIKLFMPPVGSA